MSKNCLKDPDCPDGQICSGTSKKCIALDKRAGKAEMKRRSAQGESARQSPKESPKASPKAKSPKAKSRDCPEGMIYREKTSRCVKEDGAIGKRIKKAVELGLSEEEYEGHKKAPKPPKSPKAKSPVIAKAKSRDCPEGMIYREKTSKCVKEDGAIGKRIKKAAQLGLSEDDYEGRKKAKPVSPKADECPEGMIYREKTGKYVKESGAIGKRIKKAAELGLTEEQYEALPKDKRKAEYLAKSPKRAEKIKRKHVTPKCISRSKLPLRDVQIKTVEHFIDNDSLLVVHGTGMGKTLTAVTAAECYLSSHPKGKVIVVTGLSLISNFRETLDKYGSKNKKKYEIYNYDKFLNKYKSAKNVSEDKDDDTEEDEDDDDEDEEYSEDKSEDEEDISEDPCGCKNSMLIIDEIHTLKNYEGQKFIAAMECAKYADKVLLLTATPYMNTVCDFISIINLLNRKYVVAPKKQVNTLNPNAYAPIYLAPRTTKISGCKKSASKLNAGEIRGQMNLLAPFLEGKVSFAEKPLGGDYPAVEMHKITIPMNIEYEKAFRIAVSEEESDIFSNPKAFYNGYRRAVNRISKDIGASAIFSDKLKYVSKHIIKKGVSGNLIFSNWLKFGVEVISDFLDKKHISYGVISGETPVEERKMYVEQFNKGKINTLVISSAGGTGLDLQGVQNIIVLDPVWNAAQLDQIIGRGVRYRSHFHLPEDKQKVSVYLITLVESSFHKKLVSTSKSGDYLLYKIIEAKQKFGKIVESILKRISVVDNTE